MRLPAPAPCDTIGAMAPKAATLHAVNVPARPAASANSRPAAVPPMPTALASWPTTVLATFTPIVVSTKLADQNAATRSPATALSAAIRHRWIGNAPVTVESGEDPTSLCVVTAGAYGHK